MDGFIQNATLSLVRLILAITSTERHSIPDQSLCQYIYCTFPIDDYDNRNTSCHVTTEEMWKENSQSTTLSHFIHLYVYPLFILMGIFGNSLSCFIMFINVRRSGYPTSLYLTVLALVDCLFLLGSAVPDWISQIQFTLDIKHLSDLSCRFVYWFGNFTTHLSAGLVVGVTVERFIAVQYPLIAHKLNTVTHTRIALIILILFFFLLDSPVFFLVKHFTDSVHIVFSCPNDTRVHYERRDTNRCVSANDRYGQVWVCVDFTVYTLLPFLMIVTLNSLIIRRLIDAQRFRQRMFRFSNDSVRQDQYEIKYRPHSHSHQLIEISDKYSRYSRRFRSVPETKPLAKMLSPQSGLFSCNVDVSIVCLFLFLGQHEERRRRYSTKQSSISTELSTLSSEIKTRSQHHLEISSIRPKPSANISHSNNTRLTILLLFVSFSFLVLTLPAVLLNLILSRRSSWTHPSLQVISIDDNHDQRTTLFYTIARLFMIINHSINFILYFVFGKRFRRDVKQLFVVYWKQPSH